VQGLNGAATLTDTFTVQTEDGTAQVVTITIHAQNDAPGLDLDADNSTATGSDYSAFYIPQGSPMPITDTDVSEIDLDDDLLHSAAISLTNAKPSDSLAVSDPAALAGLGISVDPSSTATSMVLTGAASQTSYQSALHLIVFSNSSQNPDTTPRDLTVVLNDG